MITNPNFVRLFAKFIGRAILKKSECLQIDFSSRSSRLSSKRQVQEVLGKEFKKHKLKIKSPGQVLYVRFFRDQCTISFDTTGLRGQFRGDDKKVGGASLRDNIAAALLRYFLQGTHEGSFVLLDPMMGSGTFLNEALMYHNTLNRDFAYQKIPGLKPPLEKKQGCYFNLEKIYGFDRDDTMVELARKNFKDSPSVPVELAVKDLFNDSYQIQEAEEKRFVIVNPPWGKRLKKLPEDWLQVLEQKLKPHRLGILIPHYWKIEKFGMEKIKELEFENSGVKNRFLVFAR